MASESEFEKNVKSDTSLQTKDLINIFISGWKWFAASLVIAVGLAVLYILMTPPVYLRTASLLVKDDNPGGSIGSGVASMFSDLGLGGGNSNVYNEMITIQSPAIVLEVVRRLSLDDNYSIKGTFHREALYGKTQPIKIKLLDVTDEQGAALDVELLDNNRIELSRFVNDEGDKIKETVEGKLNQTIKTPIGKVIVTPTDYYAAFMKSDKSHKVRMVHSDLFSAMEGMKDNLSVTMVDEDGTVIEVSYKDVIPVRATDIINTLIQVYRQDWVTDRNEITRSTSEFITDRLAVIEKELGDVDTDISSFKSENLMPDMETASKIYFTHTREAGNMILELNNRLSMAKYIRTYLLSPANANRLLPANAGIESTAIERQISDYNEMQLQRNSLIANSSDTNPLVVDLDQSLVEMRKAINTSIENYIVDLNTQIKSIEKDEQSTYAQIAASPGQEKYLLTIGRQQKVKEALYLFLLQKREENELSQTFNAFNTRLLSPPTGSVRPISPRKFSILLIALVIGFIIPTVIVLLKAKLVTTVSSRKDLEHMKVPLIGEIPQFGGRKRRRNVGRHFHEGDESSIVVEAGSRDVTNEAFRVLRTNIEFMAGHDSRCKVIGLTSINPGSGKSTIALNLGLAFALKGKRVLLVDCDMRRGSISAFIPDASKGLSDYLNGDVDSPKDIIVNFRTTPTGHLDIIPVGTVPPNPSELIDQKRMFDLIDDLRPDYDFIFLDCPPIDILADTQILSRMFDRTLFVIRAGIFERSMISEIDNAYTENRFKNISAVLNGTDTTHSRYGTSGYGYTYTKKKGFFHKK